MRFQSFPVKLNIILLTVYLTAVNVFQVLLDGHTGKGFLAVAVFLAVLLSAAIASVLLRIASSLEFAPDEGKKKKWHRFSFFAAPFLVFLLYYLAWYPGNFSVDSIEQYGTLLTHRYNDWHPVLQTLLAIKLPLLLTGGWIGSIMLFQILLFSAALGYSFCAMEEYAGCRFTFAAMAYILLNPLTGYIATFPWKDTTFAICALALMTSAVRVYYTDGVWLRRKRNFLFFVFVFAVATVCRHNGLLFTVPLLVGVSLQLDRKRVVALVVAAAALVLLVKGPLYAALQVEKPENRQVETLGMPMTVIGGAVTIAPEKTDPDILDFAYRVAPREVWEEYYDLGNFNSVKRAPGTDLSVIEEYGTGKILNMTLRCMKNTPYAFLVSFLHLTEGLYTVNGANPAVILPQVVGNDYGIASAPLLPAAQRLLWAYYLVLLDQLPQVFFSYGVAHLILIVAVLAKCRLNRLRDWKKILLVLPVFCYNYGTALLLTGYDDIARFFYYTLPVLPVALLFFFGKGKADS